MAMTVKEHGMPIATAIIVGLMSGLFGMQQAKIGTTPSLLARITQLEAENQRLLEMFIEIKAENQGLRMQQQAQFSSSPRGTIINFLDALLTQPSWCKYYVPSEDTFRMMHPNRAYQSLYDITEARYRNQRDVDIHGQVIGSQYEANDRLVLEKKGFLDFSETVKIKGKAMHIRAWKFHVALPDGTDLVCGIQDIVEDDEEKAGPKE
jgi:hypothetical protein